VVVPPEGFLAGVRDICDRNDILLILDEVQTGMGRCGTLFAYEGEGVVPDVMTLAKALAGGLPMGACLAGKKCAEVFVPGSHASTFGGNPLVSAAAIAALETTVKDGVLENCREAGGYLMERLSGLAKKYPLIREVRGRGLLVGAEVTSGGKEIVEGMRKRKVLINLTAERVLRFIPPLVVGRGEIDEAIGAFLDTLHEIG
jgi:acetylornithine/N-succinyldiaminopimelate aminotransferase